MKWLVTLESFPNTHVVVLTYIIIDRFIYAMSCCRTSIIDFALSFFSRCCYVLSSPFFELFFFFS